MGLQDKLNDLLAQSMQRIPPDAAKIMANVMEELKTNKITDKSKRKGDHAPDFELVNTNGNIINSKTLREKGPLVISFYRGSW